MSEDKTDAPAPQGNLIHDNSTNAPPAEAKIPEMPVAPDVELIAAALRGEHKKFFADAEVWITSVERAPKEITDAAMAARFAKTITELAKARKDAETIHAAAKAPWFSITKTIDSLFLAGVKTRAEAAEKIMLARQKVWIGKVADEERKRQLEVARLAQVEADRLKDLETERLAQAEKAMDRGDMDGAAQIMDEAVHANEAAQESEQAAVQATDKAEGKIAGVAKTHHAVGVTTSARTFWNAELLPRDALTEKQQVEFWNRVAPFLGPDVLQKAARAAVKAGLRECPGIKIYEDFTPTNRG